MAYTPKKNDHFFIGWGSKEVASPPLIDRRVMLLGGLSLLATSAGLGYMLAKNQMPTGQGNWDQSKEHQIVGLVSNHPYPHIVTMDFGNTPRTALLACEGKCAAQVQIDNAEGMLVTVTGSLIERGHYRMLAVKENGPWIEPLIIDGLPSYLLDLKQHQQKVTDLGDVTLKGEILDSKCWYGAMKPGRGKAHKACATLCIKGGLAPAFFTKTKEGIAAPILLNEKGQPHDDRILPLVADPTAVKGRLVQIGDMLTLRVAFVDIARR